MRLIEYIKRTNAVDKRALSHANSEKLLNFFEAGIPLSELAEHNRELLKFLPGPQLRRLVEARRNWQQIEECRESLIKTLNAKGAKVPPDALFNTALSFRRMEALEHIIPLFGANQFPSEEKWVEAIEVALGVWTGALNLSMKKGQIHIETTSLSQTAETERLVGKEGLYTIANEKWVAISRGVAQGALTISFEFPVSSISSHLEGVFSSLGQRAREVGLEEVLNQLVLYRLPAAITRNFERKLLDERLKNLGSLYFDMLKTPPIRVAKMGCVYADAELDTAGLTVISDKGKVLATQSLDLEGNWWERVRVFFVEQKSSYVAVPAFAKGTSPIDQLREQEGNFLAFIPVKVDAIAESAALIEGKNETEKREIALSIALGRRLFFPVKEWTELDPISIMPPRVLKEVEERILRRYLLEQKGLALMDPSLERIPPRVLPSVPSGHVTSGGRLNPSIRSIDHVKAGMSLKGIVINITKFGAFVNIGLSQEALIHVSEMSDTFVNDPSEIVSLGQQVEVTVVNVDLDKGRISLSLRTNPRPYEGKQPPRQRFEDRRRGRDEKYQSPAVRSQALKDLENLFKK